MNPRFLPWIRLWWLWTPALLLFLLSSGILIWQAASPQGRQGAIETELKELRASVIHLENINELAVAERTEASQTSEALQQIYNELFGNLDTRLTSVMRAIGSAARDAGLLPKGFGYSIRDNEKEGSVRFLTSFSVEGSYTQVRRLLSALQSSPQFLIIDSISFKGEQDPRSQNLAIRLGVSTFLSHTDSSTLSEIISRLQLETAEDNPESEGTPSAENSDAGDEPSTSPETEGGAAS